MVFFSETVIPGCCVNDLCGFCKPWTVRLDDDFLFVLSGKKCVPGLRGCFYLYLVLSLCVNDSFIRGKRSFVSGVAVGCVLDLCQTVVSRLVVFLDLVRCQ